MDKEIIAELTAFGVNVGVLTALSLQDLKSKSVNWIPIAALAILNLVLGLYVGRGMTGFLTGLLPGLFALLVSLVTQGKMGVGDGITLIALGLFYTWEKLLVIWLVALVLCSVIGTVLIINKRATIKTALPFIPFLTLSFSLIKIAERAFEWAK